VQISEKEEEKKKKKKKTKKPGIRIHRFGPADCVNHNRTRRNASGGNAGSACEPEKLFLNAAFRRKSIYVPPMLIPKKNN